MVAMISTSTFNRLISATKKFVAKTTSSPIHEYIQLRFSKDESKVTAAAVDGYRLSIEHCGIIDCDEDFVAYIRPNVKLPSGQKAVISIEGKEAMIRCNGVVFGFQQPVGEFLQYEAALPKSEVKLRIGFNAGYLLEALQAAKASTTYQNQPMVLEFRGPLEPVIIRTNSEDIKMVLPIRIKEG